MGLHHRRKVRNLSRQLRNCPMYMRVPDQCKQRPRLGLFEIGDRENRFWKLLGFSNTLLRQVGSVALCSIRISISSV